jgi:hypothetical protein
MSVDIFKIWYRWSDDDADDIKEAKAALVDTDASQKDVDALLDRSDILYVFNRGEKILGTHGEFTVVYTEVVYA